MFWKRWKNKDSLSQKSEKEQMSHTWVTFLTCWKRDRGRQWKAMFDNLLLWHSQHTNWNMLLEIARCEKSLSPMPADKTLDDFLVVFISDLVISRSVTTSVLSMSVILATFFQTTARPLLPVSYLVFFPCCLIFLCGSPSYKARP